MADAAGYLAAQPRPQSITGIIDETIARWDGEATSRKIELQVGPRPAVHPDQRHRGRARWPAW